MHESNTFAGRTTLADFERGHLLTGPVMRERLAGTHHEIGGFFEQLRQEGVEAVPVFAAWALPSGTIEEAAADELMRRLANAFPSAGRLDGVLFAAHGAAVAAHEPDLDGAWLTQLPSVVMPMNFSHVERVPEPACGR